ncbi:MAG: antitoxin VbhA family protein [Pseudolysinimonas sp.]|uniref:antitoxin VbhA family protein n=1 Tax=Pseudolysinimonas sp. TaxID=2680009 RepID=UPI003266BF74
MTDAMQTTVTGADVARRQAIVDEARHSSELEGGRSTDDVRALQDSWAAGEITLEQLLEGTAARYPSQADR